MQQHMLTGNVRITKRYDRPIRKYPQAPNPSGVSFKSSNNYKLQHFFKLILLKNTIIHLMRVFTCHLYTNIS